MPTKAEKKHFDALQAAFNARHAATYGEERWTNSLLPALERPVRYAALVNAYASRGEFEHTLSTNDIRPETVEGIALPGSTDSSSHVPSIVLLQRIPRAQVMTETSEVEKKGKGGALKKKGQEELLFPVPWPSTSGALLTHWNLDPASVFAAALLDVRPGERVLDLCAAPGGKTLTLAQRLFPSFHASVHSSSEQERENVNVNEKEKEKEERGCLHANEVDPARSKRLAANLASYLPPELFSSGQVQTFRLDGRSALSELPFGQAGYDKVLLDAPCSSERHIVLARDYGRWKASASASMARLQTALLLRALDAVRPGGQVLYSTCSLAPAENDGVVSRVLELLNRPGLPPAVQCEPSARPGTETCQSLDGMSEPTALGRIALPDGGRAWGPLYFCLLTKVA